GDLLRHLDRGRGVPGHRAFLPGRRHVDGVGGDRALGPGGADRERRAPGAGGGEGGGGGGGRSNNRAERLDREFALPTLTPAPSLGGRGRGASIDASRSDTAGALHVTPRGPTPH